MGACRMAACASYVQFRAHCASLWHCHCMHVEPANGLVGTILTSLMGLRPIFGGKKSSLIVGQCASLSVMFAG